MYPRHSSRPFGLAGNRLRPCALALAIFSALCASPARAQVLFSIDYRGATIGGPPDSFTLTPITAGDILTPATGAGLPAYAPPAVPVPGKVIPVGAAPFPGLMLPAAGACPLGIPCGNEVDALSFGTDFNPAAGGVLAGRWIFSVDELAVGAPGSPYAPNVFTEAPFGDCAADVFEALLVPVGPVAPPVPAAPTVGNTGIIDGNGVVSPSTGRYAGLGLVEPRLAGAFLGGDNVDALDVDTPAIPAAIYFSLDAAFLDPALLVLNSGSAAANGFLPGAILWKPAIGAPPILVYAPPAVLGLDLAGPPGSDDLDALSLTENGVAGFQMGPGGDVPYYSVRRGSAVIGLPDSLFGLPIEPGDILTLPIPGGVSPFPSIYVAAEWLGLATTRTNGVPFGGDDLDALDCRAAPLTGFPFCFGDGTGAACPCGPVFAGASGNGCANSVIAAGASLTATGTASVAASTVVMTSSGELPAAASIFLQGTAPIAPVVFGDGLRCTGGALLRMYVVAAVGGVATAPPAGGLAFPAQAAALGGPIAAGTYRYYQTYYRDPAPLFCPAPLGNTWNASQGLVVLWAP
jgi:hypothetical protein